MLEQLNTYSILSIKNLYFVLLEIVLILISIKILLPLNLKRISRYEGVQKIHSSQVSRLAGVIIFGLTAIYIFFDNAFTLNFFTSLVIFFIPILLLTLPEDLHIHVNPWWRLIVMLLTSLIFLYFLNIELPLISIPILASVINHPMVAIIFYSLALTVLMNGANFIDGTNGLFNFTSISILLAICFFSILFGEIGVLSLSIFLIAMLTCFCIFNFPLGKIFMGDVGAYWISWLIGCSLIYLFGKHHSLLSWTAVLIIFYPAMEVLFSFIRKLLQKKSPLKPDPYHLHLKLFNYFNSSSVNKPLVANNLVAPTICFLWVLPPLASVVFYKSLFLTLFALIFFIATYTLFYFGVPNINNEKIKQNN